MGKSTSVYLTVVVVLLYAGAGMAEGLNGRLAETTIFVGYVIAGVGLIGVLIR
jgi:hypothetical protein